MVDDLTIGAHVEQSRCVDEALARGFATAQIFLGNPQSYKGPALDYPGGPAQLKADAAASGIGIYVHAPYLINVATTNNKIRIPSRQLLAKHAKAAAEVGALGLIVHGGHVGADEDASIGFDNWRKAIAGLESEVPILIENTAGGDNAMARHFDAVARLWDAVASRPTRSRSASAWTPACARVRGGSVSAASCGPSPDASTWSISTIRRTRRVPAPDRHESLGRGLCDPGPRRRRSPRTPPSCWRPRRRGRPSRGRPLAALAPGLRASIRDGVPLSGHTLAKVTPTRAEVVSLAG